MPIKKGCARLNCLASRDLRSEWLEACPAEAQMGHPPPDWASRPNRKPITTRGSPYLKTPFLFAPALFPNPAGIGGFAIHFTIMVAVMTIMPLSVHVVRILLERSLIKHKNDNPATTAWRSDDLINAIMTYRCCPRRTNMRGLDLPEVDSS